MIARSQRRYPQQMLANPRRMNLAESGKKSH